MWVRAMVRSSRQVVAPLRHDVIIDESPAPPTPTGDQHFFFISSSRSDFCHLYIPAELIELGPPIFLFEQTVDVWGP